MLNVASKRWPLVKITLFDTIVQGENSAPSIAHNIEIADKLKADIIVIGRGGGSLEDLWAFNEEIVADTIFKAKTPIISAVGHEIDYMISDFVADLRAPTPSAAMEIALPDRAEMLMFLDSILNTYNTHVRKIIEHKSKDLQQQVALLKQNSYEAKFGFYKNEIENIQKGFQNFFKLKLDQKHNLLEQLLQSYKINDPSKKDKIGYAQISKNGKTIELEKLKVGDIFSSQTSKVEVIAEVKEIR
jgi:exodeoxyribonuclease VII large subunit